MPSMNLDTQPLLRVENLEKRYRRNGAAHASQAIAALEGVSLSLYSQTTMALVGESGSGKSTLASCLACLEKPTAGRIWFRGAELTGMDESQLRDVRPQIQLVFQDPARSLNPRWSALEIVTEPLVIRKGIDRREQRERARALFDQVGLLAGKLDDRPEEFSGGQRQRLALARALALQPELLVLDEVLSALDCSVQAQMVNLLLELQSSAGLTYLFITHDLGMAAHLSDQIAVLHQGRIVEIGPTDEVVRSPQHPVTQGLLSIARESQGFPRATWVV
jgi:ABC-type glutathione transport system ATPase component